MTALLADAGVEGGVAMIVIDVMPPMATSVKAMHRGDNLLDYHHIDSITYFKALPQGLQKIFIMNHDAIVSSLVTHGDYIKLKNKFSSGGAPCALKCFIAARPRVSRAGSIQKNRGKNSFWGHKVTFEKK